jgi:predicted RND superfamily exporter protein
MKRDSAEKFEIFTKVCVIVFILLILLKLFVINISWLIVFIPIIVPVILIMWQLGLFNGNL